MSAGASSRRTRQDEHVNDMDALFWRVERDPLLRNTMTAIFVLDRAPDRSILMDRIERASRVVPGWRHRLVSPPFNLSNPRWIVDPDFDLTYHVRWIGAPKERTFASVLDYARTSATSGLDRDRPLWTFTVVDGLEGDGAAVIVKLHHVLIDGLGGIGLLPLIVDFGPEQAELGPMPVLPEYRPMSSLQLMIDAVATNRRRLYGGALSAGRAAVRHAPDAARDPTSIVRSVRRNMKALGRLLKPPTEALSPIMTERRGWSRFVPLSADLASLKRTSAEQGASVNDAFLAAVACGFARYHERQGSPVHQLRTTVAVNGRKPGDPIHGNHVLGGHFVMPVGTDDPREYMGAYHAIIEELRDDVRQPLASATSSAVNALGPLISTYVGVAMKNCDLLMSNIPGVDVPIWLGGAAVSALYGFGPTMGTATNATLVSYNGTAHIGLNVDVSAVTDLDLLVECVSEVFGLLTGASTEAPHRRTSKQRAAVR